MSEKDSKARLDVEVPLSLALHVTLDAKEFQKTKDGIVESALRHFFSASRFARKQHYRKIPNKIFGRPL